MKPSLSVSNLENILFSHSKMFEFLVDLLELREQGLRPCLHEQIKQRLFEQIRPGLLHTDREFEQLKEVLFAHVNAALDK